MSIILEACSELGFTISEFTEKLEVWKEKEIQVFVFDAVTLKIGQLLQGTFGSFGYKIYAREVSKIQNPEIVNIINYWIIFNLSAMAILVDIGNTYFILDINRNFISDFVCRLRPRQALSPEDPTYNIDIRIFESDLYSNPIDVPVCVLTKNEQGEDILSVLNQRVFCALSYYIIPEDLLESLLSQNQSLSPSVLSVLFQQQGIASFQTELATPGTITNLLAQAVQISQNTTGEQKNIVRYVVIFLNFYRSPFEESYVPYLFLTNPKYSSSAPRSNDNSQLEFIGNYGFVISTSTSQLTGSLSNTDPVLLTPQTNTTNAILNDTSDYLLSGKFYTNKE